jgi:GT2 family glycosyltransferase
MGNAPRVSVVIAVCHATDAVQEAVSSALAAQLEDVEVLLVDNGALAGAALSGDPRVVSVHLRADAGVARARNVGIARARAPYVAFLEPQARLQPDSLASALRALEGHLQAGFCFADGARSGPAGPLRPSMSPFPRLRSRLSTPVGDDCFLIPQPELARALLYEQFVPASGLVLRRALLTELGPFDESLVYAGELDLGFRLAHHGGALFCDRVGYISPAQAEDPATLHARLDERIVVLQRERARWRDAPAHMQIDRLIAEALAAMGLDARRRRHRLRSMAMFAQAYSTRPDVRWLRGLIGSVFS